MAENNSGFEKGTAHIQESMIKKGGCNPKPDTPKPNVTPPSQKPSNSSSSKEE